MNNGSVDNTLGHDMDQHLVNSYRGKTCKHSEKEWIDVSKAATASMIMEHGIYYIFCCSIFYIYKRNCVHVKKKREG